MNISQFLTKLKTLVYSKNEMDTMLITKANDSAVVHTRGAEDISGNKNFIDNLTRGGKNVDTIEEQGDGYIRYSNGIQICWGNGIYEEGQVVSYAKAFSGSPSVVASKNIDPENWHPLHFTVAKTVTQDYNYASWQAIGYWK